jgi:hypothetical protein
MDPIIAAARFGLRQIGTSHELVGVDEPISRLAARGRIAPSGVAKFLPEMAAILTRAEFE